MKIGVAVIHLPDARACAPVLALVAALAACGPPTSDRIRNAEKLGKQETAEQLEQSGRAFAAVGDTTRAEEYLAAAIERGGDETRLMPLLLEVCVRDGRFQMAIEYARPYLGKHPADQKTRYLLATLYAGVGALQDAQTHAEVVVGARPSQPEPHFLLATVLRDRGDRVGADGHFRQYLALAPRGSHADEARASLLRAVPTVSAMAGDGGAAPTLILPAGAETDGGAAQTSPRLGPDAR